MYRNMRYAWTLDIRYKPLAVAMVRVEGGHEKTYPVVEAVGMWESRRDFQRVWEGWEAGFMAFHAFHTLSFPTGLLLARQMLDKPNAATQCNVPYPTRDAHRYLLIAC